MSDLPPPPAVAVSANPFPGDTLEKSQSPRVAIIGGGPAGLMAAEALSGRGLTIDLYDAMPTVGRKFLLAGKGGLNLTHAEPLASFIERYYERSTQMAPYLARFGPDALRAWADDLGIGTFVGSSGKVFPEGMKAAPLLRAWLHRLRERGVRFHMRHRWLGWEGACEVQASASAPLSLLLSCMPLSFGSPAGVQSTTADVVVLALGGASWSRLGSDGAWVPLLKERRIDVAPLKPSNCGFDVDWSPHFQARHAGQPLKSISARFVDLHGQLHERTGELLVTAEGLEGSLVYAWSAMLRDQIAARGSATLVLDLAPDRTLERIIGEVVHPRGSRSLSSHLQSRAGIHGVKAGLLRECLGADAYNTSALLAAGIKALPITLNAARPLDEAISSAGGVRFEALDADLMAHAMPGLFCCGEMLDWEAPTGGYLLTACFASGRAAGEGAARWLAERSC